MNNKERIGTGEKLSLMEMLKKPNIPLLEKGSLPSGKKVMECLFSIGSVLMIPTYIQYFSL